MIDIEQPACFYLGKEYDLKSRTVLDQPVMYEARDLTTHGVVVGMTGSGKTGLCLTILEEAAIDGYPCIIIDLKGDLSNLLLNFPELQAEQFKPWIDPGEAKRKKRTVEEQAEVVAEAWRGGLAEWGQGPDRIARLKKSSEWRIYTPGSEAGLPLSILANFSAPKGKFTREALTERVESTASALLGLTAAAADPVQSREHILIANLLLHAWLQGKDLNLERIIQQIQSPPINKIGAFDVETFYPEKERMKLAVALNNILASPGFAAWVTGEPLDLAKMLYASDGRPRQCIFYLAHLDDTQRMFFLTLLLEEVLAWTRSQPGTTSLRALLYFDEVFGYLPPHPGNPPTKLPLMTLMKQARAFGVGVLLATQNPVDLDYKALTNAGTWFVGKLQTERDKARLLEGLEGVAAAQGTMTDRKHLDQIISALGNRVFLMHNVHAGKPIVMQTRWALSYLAGPLTREHISRLMEQEKEAQSQSAEEVPARKSEEGQAAATDRFCTECGTKVDQGGKFCSNCGARLPVRIEASAEDQFKQGMARSPSKSAIPGGDFSGPPILSSDVPQFYLPVLPLASPVGSSHAAKLHYEVRLLASAEIQFNDQKKGQSHLQTRRLIAIPPSPGQNVAWHNVEPIPEEPATTPEAVPATFGPVPASVNDGKKLRSLEKSFVDFLYTNASLPILYNKTFDLYSQPDEDEQTFLKRCRTAAQAASEGEVAELERKFRKKFEALDASLGAARAELEQSQAQARRRHNEELLRSGTSILKTLFGWGRSMPWLPRSDTASERQVHRAASEIEKYQTQRQRLQAEWEESIAAVAAKWQAKAEEIKDIRLTPRKSDIRVIQFGLAWAPFWHVESDGRPARILPAYASR